MSIPLTMCSIWWAHHVKNVFKITVKCQSIQHLINGLHRCQEYRSFLQWAAWDQKGQPPQPDGVIYWFHELPTSKLATSHQHKWQLINKPLWETETARRLPAWCDCLHWKMSFWGLSNVWVGFPQLIPYMSYPGSWNNHQLTNVP